jgi:hypothetical protein
MAGNYLIFQGDVKISLFGQNALLPLSICDEVLTSVLGSEDSNFFINEHRQNTIQMLRNLSTNEGLDGFPRVFNQSAWAEIRYTPDTQGLEIDLYDATHETRAPILWMGVLNDNIMPAYKTNWEIFKSLDENNTAFCAFVNA